MLIANVIQWLVAFFFCYVSSLSADSWEPAQPIPPGTPIVAEDVTLAYNSGNQTTIAAWAQFVSGAPYYAVYDGTNWTTPATAIPLGASTGVNGNINLAYDAANQVIVAVWQEGFSSLFYAIFDGTSWTTPGTPIPLGTSASAINGVNVTYNPANQTVVAAWAEFSAGRPAYYAVYDGTSWTTLGTPIPLGTSSGVNVSINLAYNANNQTIVAAWGNLGDTLPYYAVFDGTTWTTAGTPIPPGTSTGVVNNVRLTYDGNNQTIIAAWGDNLGTSPPYYSIFDGINWITTGTIPQGTGNGVYQDVSLAYNSDSEEVFAAWNENSIFAPFYSIFDGTNWSVGDSIPLGTSDAVDFQVNLSFDPSSHQMIAAWANFGPFNDLTPYYSTYLTTVPPPPPPPTPTAPAPPASISGSGFYNKFLTQQVWVNQLNWTPSTSAEVVAYNIYRDGEHIAHVNATTLEYFDQGQNKKVPHVYAVTALGGGAESTAVTIILPKERR